MQKKKIADFILSASEVDLPKPNSLIPESTNIVHDYPVQRLGQILSSAALAIQSKTQAPIELCGQSVLLAASLSVQHYIDVKLPSGDVRPTSLFCVSIAQSGERKTSVDKMALKSVKNIEKSRRKEFEGLQKKRRGELEVWESKRRYLQKKVSQGDDSFEQELRAHLALQPEEISLPILIVDDTTTEGLIKTFTKQDSLALFTSEGGQFLGGYSHREENAINTISTLSKFWDGGDITNIRASRDPFTISDKRLSVHLMLQPEMAKTFLNDKRFNDQGILSRFICVSPPSAIGKRFHRTFTNDEAYAHEQNLNKFYNCIDKFFQTPPKDKVIMTFSPDAEKNYYYMSDEVEKLMAEGNKFESIRPFANKLTEHAARISAVITLLEDPKSRIIEASTFREAQILAMYFADEILRIKGLNEISEELKNAEKLRVWLKENWKEEHVSMSDLMQYGPNSLRKKAVLLELISILVAHHWLIPIPENLTIGEIKRKKVYYINRD